MSKRPSSKKSKSLLSVGVVLFAALVLGGCGGGAKTSAGVSSGGGATTTDGSTATSAAGQTSAVTAATGAQGATGQTGGADTGGTTVKKVQPPAGDESGARTPVAITIKNGRFSAPTVDRVHVPPYIAIELDVGVRDQSDYNLELVSANSPKPLLKKVHPGYSTVELEGLRPAKTLTVALGSQQVVVVADAVPGP